MRAIVGTRTRAAHARDLGSVWLGILVLSLLGARSAAAEDEERCTDPAFRDSYACRQIIVKYGPGFDPVGLCSRHPGLEVIGLIPQLSQAWIEAPRGSDVPLLLKQITAPPPSGEPGVRSAERNGEYVSPECRQLNAPILDARATPLLLAQQDSLAVMDAAPDGSFGAGIVVAVLDTGVDRSHPFLSSGSFLPGIDVVVSGGDAGDRGDGIDQDGNGVVDDGFGHGTAVAGLIRLAAPGAVILPVKVLDDECRGTAFALAMGVVRAVDGGARILNASLGGHEESEAVGEALDYAAAHGVMVIAAAGDLRRSGGHEADDEDEVQFPASHRQSLAVAAVNVSYVAPPTTILARAIKLCAPGVGVLAPWRSGYARVNGTSFATAFVSAAAATGLSRHPSFGRASLATLLRSTAIPVDLWNPGHEGRLGAGVPDFAVLAERPPNLPRRVPGERAEGDHHESEPDDHEILRGER